MVRTYVATGDPSTSSHYREILDIRDGKSPVRSLYQDIYWDLVLADDKRPRALPGWPFPCWSSCASRLHPAEIRQACGSQGRFRCAYPAPSFSAWR
jgi:hypothetical protein